MFGFIPAAAWWLMGGWAAKSALDKMQPKVRVATGPAPVQVAPGQPVTPMPPAPIVVQGPPSARPGTRCQFDAHMDERTERAVVKCLQSGDIVKLRGFADSVTDKLPPNAYPYGHFPVAATIMRMQANLLEQQAQVAQAQAQAALAAQVPAAPAPMPSKQANGIASTPVATIVATSDIPAQSEG